ncbi:zinc finger, AN1-type domain [Haplosporangium sp. Z 767]|nr:zinc finger, AN1-type domain [Haplosporangium sp. Z 767]KAF9195916.1 zinc finger, AN1-type domain [Haplosporangium sp. Z 11]
MELPSIGKHCSDATCSQLDFLPFTCQYCKKIYCQDHWRLEGHNCPNKDKATQQDQRVPICPLCDKPVPVKKGEDPNLRMEQHISAGCPEPATTISKPIYTNSCNVKGCKNRSAIPIVCQNCKLNYCLKHRLESDHACATRRTTGSSNQKNNGGSSSASANINGKGNKGSNNNNNGNGHWSLKAANATRNERAAEAAQQRASAAASRGRSSSTGKKDKDKCCIC